VHAIRTPPPNSHPLIVSGRGSVTVTPVISCPLPPFKDATGLPLFLFFRPPSNCCFKFPPFPLLAIMTSVNDAVGATQNDDDNKNNSSEKDKKDIEMGMEIDDNDDVGLLEMECFRTIFVVAIFVC